VQSARGLPAPDYVFANDGDYGYGIFLPDPRSAAWLLEHAGSIEDGLLRALAWGGLWDLVREARLPPDLFAYAALRALPAERDEQIAALLLGRTGYALERYIPDGGPCTPMSAAPSSRRSSPASPTSPSATGPGAPPSTRSSPAQRRRAVTLLRDYLAGRAAIQPCAAAAAEPLGDRHSTPRLGDAQAPALLRAETARDSTPEAPRLAFIAGAAVPRQRQGRVLHTLLRR
jgi:aminopeptidase N